MTQRELNREVASQTGESIQTINSMGLARFVKRFPSKNGKSRSWSIGTKSIETEA